MIPAKITPEHLKRTAYIYIRQSSLGQVRDNLESRRRQYELADRARSMGWSRVEVVDEDLGRSGSGRVERPGFQRLVSAVCLEEVGGVFALEASRLAPQQQGLVPPGRPVRTDLDAHHRRRRGLRSRPPQRPVAPGPQGHHERVGSWGSCASGLLWPCVRRRNAGSSIRPSPSGCSGPGTTGASWTRTSGSRRASGSCSRSSRSWEASGRSSSGSGRKEWSSPASNTGPSAAAWVWEAPGLQLGSSFLTNPVYAGAYAYGRTRTETTIVDGQPRRRQGIPVAQGEWAVLIPEHHQGYIGWEQHQANQKRIAENAQMKGLMSRGAPRRGRSLLAGLLRCRRCGRRLHVTYSGASGQVPRYGCRGAAINHGAGSCISFGGLAADRAVEEAVLAVIQPGAIEAAIGAAEHAGADRKQEHDVLALKLEQARYEVERARRQYDAAEPENRLVAAELERRWNRALEVVAEVERERVAFEAGERRKDERIDRAALLQLAEDLPRVWHDPESDMRLKKRIVRTLIEEILVDVDEESARIHMVVRWAGGQHARLSVRKRRKGQHRYTTDRKVVEIARELAAMLPDGQIARVLNRLGLKTGRDNSWTAGRVTSLRNYHGIPVHDPETCKREGLLTLNEAAASLDVSPPVVARLLRRGSFRDGRSCRTPRGRSGPQISMSPPSRSTSDACTPAEMLRKLWIRSS